MTVYRLENKEGRGPFNTWHLKPDDKPAAMPSPWEDGLEAIEHDDVFAFQTQTKLKTWFSASCLRRLKKQGCNLVRYEVPAHKVTLGDSQCVFKKRDAYKRLTCPIRKVYH